MTWLKEEHSLRVSEGIFWREYLDLRDLNKEDKKICNNNCTLCGLRELICICLQDYNLTAMFRASVYKDEMCEGQLWYEPIHGRTICQPVLTAFLQPRHIPTRGYNITQSSAPDDGHMVSRNMLSNY